MEELVGLAPGLQDVVVDVAAGHRLPYRRRRLLVSPVSELDQKPTLGQRMQAGHPREELFAADGALATGCKDGRHAVSGPAHRLELAERVRGRLDGDDPVVALVPPELGGDPLHRIAIRLDDDDRRPLDSHVPRHRCNSSHAGQGAPTPGTARRRASPRRARRRA